MAGADRFQGSGIRMSSLSPSEASGSWIRERRSASLRSRPGTIFCFSVKKFYRLGVHDPPGGVLNDSHICLSLSSRLLLGGSTYVPSRSHPLYSGSRLTSVCSVLATRHVCLIPHACFSRAPSTFLKGGSALSLCRWAPISWCQLI